MKARLIGMLCGAVGILAVQAAFSFLVPDSARTATPPPIALELLSNALVAAVLVEIALRVHGTFPQRAAVLFAAWGGIQANNLVEAALFDIGIPKGDLRWLFVFTLLVSLIAAGGLAFMVRPDDREPQPRRPFVLNRILLCSPLYVVLYFAAGMLIAWPFVATFYQARPMPPVGEVFGLQFVRGLLFAFTIHLVLRRARGSRLALALLGGFTMNVLGGIAPLILPNAYLPDVVRLAHLAEVAVSNFIFGFIAGWWIAAPTVRRTATVPAST